MLLLRTPTTRTRHFAVRSIDPDSPIDYPNNWDEMDEIEQYAWLDNNGYGDDWTVYASQDPVHGFAKLVDEWDLWIIDLI